MPVEINTLYHSDCIDLLKQMDSNFLSGVITSPPYNIGRKYKGYKDKQKESVYLDWQVNIFNEIDKRLIQNGLILYNFSYSAGNPLLPYSLMKYIDLKTPFTLADTIIWKKPNSTPVRGNRLTRHCEFIFVICRKTEIRSFQRNIHHINYIEAENNDKRIGTRYNSQPYSTELVLRLLKIYFNTDSLIFDPFSGIGTTLRSCLIFNCNYIGTEIDNDQTRYFNEKRILGIKHNLVKLRDEYKNILNPSLKTKTKKIEIMKTAEKKEVKTIKTLVKKLDYEEIDKLIVSLNAEKVKRKDSQKEKVKKQIEELNKVLKDLDK